MIPESQPLTVLHRQLPQGRRPLTMAMQLTGLFAVSTVLLWLFEGADLVPTAIAAAVASVLGALFIWRITAQRVVIGAEEIRLVGFVRARRIARYRIDRAVHVRTLAVPGVTGGYLVLLDGAGRALWRTVPSHWAQPAATASSEDLPTALEQIAPRVERLDVLLPGQAREQHPGLLPWHFERPALGFAVGGGSVLVAALVVAGLVWLTA